MAASLPVHVERAAGGSWLRVFLNRPPANILDVEMLWCLRRACAAAAEDPAIKLVTFTGNEIHFSCGADVDDRQAVTRRTLSELHALVWALLAAPVPTAAVVRGRCLGAAFDLALACDVIFAADDATLGLSDFKAGVQAPAGAVLLPLRVGAARAARPLLSGEPLPAAEWAAAGLVERVERSAALDARVAAWFEAHLAPQSAARVRHAALASRAVLRGIAAPALADIQDLAAGCVPDGEDGTRQRGWRRRSTRPNGGVDEEHEHPSPGAPDYR